MEYKEWQAVVTTTPLSIFHFTLRMEAMEDCFP